MKSRFKNTRFAAFGINIDTMNHLRKMLCYIEDKHPELKINDGSDCPECNEPTTGVQNAKPGDVLVIYASQSHPTWNVDYVSRKYFDAELDNFVPLLDFNEGEKIMMLLQAVIKGKQDFAEDKDDGNTKTERHTVEWIGDYAILDGVIVLHKEDLGDNKEEAQRKIAMFCAGMGGEEGFEKHLKRIRGLIKEALRQT